MEYWHFFVRNRVMKELTRLHWCNVPMYRCFYVLWLEDLAYTIVAKKRATTTSCTWVSPRVKRALPWVLGSSPQMLWIGRTSVTPRPSLLIPVYKYNMDCTWKNSPSKISKLCQLLPSSFHNQLTIIQANCTRMPCKHKKFHICTNHKPLTYW